MDLYITDEDYISPHHLKRVQALARDGPHGDDTFDELLRLNQAFCKEMERHRRAVAQIHEEDTRLNLELGLEQVDLSDEELFGSSSSDGGGEEALVALDDQEGFLELDADSNLNADSMQLKPEYLATNSAPSSSLSPSCGPSRTESPTNDSGPKKFPDILSNQASQRVNQDRVNFLRAALQMADEMDGSLNTKMSDLPKDTPPIQEGYLKKQHKKYWKMKSCTLRMGVFEYIDEPSQSTFGGREGKRRCIELHNGLAYCYPHVSKSGKEKDDQDQGRAFEITLEKGPNRVFMAKDEAERDLWVKKIRSAFVNPPEKEYEEELHIPQKYDESPCLAGMQLFLDIRKQLKDAAQLDEYKVALQDVIAREQFPLVVPVAWVREQVEQVSAPPRQLKQLYKDMNRDRIAVNNVELSNQDHCMEAMVGQLMSAIIGKATQGGSTYEMQQQNRLSEATALKAARDVLMAVNRTQSGGDTYLCISALAQVPEMVVICPTSRIVEPMQIQVQGLDDLNYVQTESPVKGLFDRDLFCKPKHRKAYGSGSDVPESQSAPSSMLLKIKDSYSPLPREHGSTPQKRRGHRRNHSEPVVPSAATLAKLELSRDNSADNLQSFQRPHASSDNTFQREAEQITMLGAGNSGAFILQIHVTAKTSYRIVFLDPTADADENIAIVHCEFQQMFKMFRSSNTTDYETKPEEAVIQIQFETPAKLNEDNGLQCMKNNIIGAHEPSAKAESSPPDESSPPAS